MQPAVVPPESPTHSHPHSTAGLCSSASRKAKHICIIKIDFYSRPWNLSVVTTVRSGGCTRRPHEWRRKRVQQKWGGQGGAKSTQRKKRKQLENSYLHYLCYNTATIKSGFDESFVHFVYITTNKSKLQKFGGVQNLRGLSDIAKIELKIGPLDRNET